MKITVLGHWGAYPDANEATAGYLVQTDKINLLLDCGSGILSLLQNYVSLDELDGVILSHYHGDHMADINSLQYSTMIQSKLGNRKKPLIIYGINQQPYFNKLSYGEYCKAVQIDNNSVLDIEDLRITFSGNIHPMPCLSMKIQQGSKSFVYTGDTEWTENLIDLAKGTDLLISECTLYNDQFKMIPGHLTAGEAGKIASKANVDKLMLTHLPHYGDHNLLVSQAKEEFNKEVQLARRGLIVEL